MKRLLILALILCSTATLEAGLFRNRSVKVMRQNGRVVRKEIRVTPKAAQPSPTPKPSAPLVQPPSSPATPPASAADGSGDAHVAAPRPAA